MTYVMLKYIYTSPNCLYVSNLAYEEKCCNVATSKTCSVFFLWINQLLIDILSLLSINKSFFINEELDSKIDSSCWILLDYFIFSLFYQNLEEIQQTRYWRIHARIYCWFASMLGKLLNKLFKILEMSKLLKP